MDGPGFNGSRVLKILKVKLCVYRVRVKGGRSLRTIKILMSSDRNWNTIRMRTISDRSWDIKSVKLLWM